MMSSHILFVDLVAIPEGPHPIPFRTRSLSPPGPMVLRLKARESRSPPGLPKGCVRSLGRSGSDLDPIFTPLSLFAAGWSSPVARQAHNLKVIGSNPIPAPKFENGPRLAAGAVFVSGSPIRPCPGAPRRRLFRASRAAPAHDDQRRL